MSVAYGRRIASANDSDAINASLAMVDKADIYVGIFAYRYGYVPKGHDISITEMEYEQATTRRIPRLIFLAQDDIPVLPKDFDRGEDAVKLERLKERLKVAKVAKFFKNPDDMRAQ